MVTAGITSMRKMAGTSAKTGNQMDLMQTLPRSRDAGVFQKMYAKKQQREKIKERLSGVWENF